VNPTFSIGHCRALAMLRRVPRIAILSMFAVAAPLAAQSFSGTWSGTYQIRDSGCAIVATGPITVELNQGGSTVNGLFILQVTQSNCQAVPAFTAAVPVSGAATGNSMTGSAILPGSAGPASEAFTATLSPTTLSVTSTASDGFAATLTQTSAAPPDSSASGIYSGTYDLISNQNGCTSEYKGTLDGPLTQAGPYLAGVLTVGGRQGLSGSGCTLVPKPDVPTQLSVLISGTTISGYDYIYQDNGQATVVAPVSGTLIGTTLSGAASDPSGQNRGSLTFVITRTTGPTTPSVVSFTANPATIAPGSSTTLSWATTDASAVTIDNGVGSQAVAGSVVVHPASTTTYTLTATGQASSATAKATVTVAPVASPPNVVVTAFPQGMLQALGSPLPSDHYTLTNFGGTVTTVTLAQSGSFFTQTPTSFNLQPNSSQVVVINATTQPAGNYSGSSSASGSGVAGGLSVPVQLLVAAAPGAPVTITSPVIRSEVSGPEGQEPSGSVSFTNPSSTEIEGFVVADVPWIIIQNPVLSIKGGRTEDVHFSIDRAQRPDGSAPIGGVIGSISFRYLNGGAGKTTVLGTTIPASVSVSIVDVVTPNAAPGAPPPLAAGEVAFFVPGASSKLGATGDLVLSNRGSSTISDLKMFFAPAGSTASQVSSVGQFLSNSGISFPSVLQNVFSNPSQTGTLQLRSTQISNIAVSQTQITSGGGKSFITALPLLRSDRGFDPGQALYLPGVQKTGTMSTNLYLQELTGNNAALKIDFIDSSGTVISSRTTDTLAPFGALELPNVVPANAATVRVTNTSSAAAKIDGYALVIDGATNDAYTVMQIGPVTDTMICPAFAAPSGSRDLFLNLTNASSAPITVTESTVSAEGRRRAVSHSFSATSGSPNSVTIPASGFQHMRVNDSGVIRLAGSTSVRASATFSTSGGGGTFGSGVGVFPTTRAFSINQGKRFAGIEDSSTATIAAGRPLTYRTNLLLAETTGQAVTVRLTLRFVFSAGAKVSASAVTSRDVDVPAGSFALLNNLAQSIVGVQRASFGDLHNAILDVEVVGGAGSVLPFLQMVDNATGEVTIRHE
jgi:hypothetical protein